MKYTYGFWAAIFFISWLTGGLFTALFVTALALGSCVTTGNSVANRHELGSSSRKQLY